MEEWDRCILSSRNRIYQGAINGIGKWILISTFHVYNLANASVNTYTKYHGQLFDSFSAFDLDYNVGTVRS